jgi:ribosomal protein S18 acetylase RimI-like enzyme
MVGGHGVGGNGRVSRTINPGSLRVRHADLLDAGVLASLGARSFVDAFAADNDPRDIERYVAESFAEARIATELAKEGSTFLLAYDDDFSLDSPIGYSRLQGGSTTDAVTARRPVELVRIYVEPSLIGHGYGSALLQLCLDEAAAKGYDVIWLGVWEHNDRARRFYERWGFQQVGERVFVLGDDVQTDHVMARPIQRATGAAGSPGHDVAVPDATTS